MHKISIAIPIYDMPNGDFFLDRCLESIKQQTFKNYDVIITKKGKMAENTNEAIKRSTGDLIKILYMDDYLTHKNALQVIVEAFRGYWLVSGCKYDPIGGEHLPTWNEQMHLGMNTIGSPSVLTILNEKPMLFDENLGWLLDCDYYRRMYDKYGEPIYLNDLNVVIGVGDHQATNLMGEDIKIKEHNYIQKKYDTSAKTNN